MDQPRPDPEPTEGAAKRALARIEDARRRGSSAATRLAENLLAGIEDAAAAPKSSAGDTADALRRARRGVEIAVEGALEALRGATDAVDGLISSDATSTPVGIESLALEADPAQQVHTTLWIHNQTSYATGSIELRCSELVNLAGRPLDAKAWFAPASLDPIGVGQSRSVDLNLVPSALAEPGEYHGLVLITGVDRLEPLHVKVAVGDRTGRQSTAAEER